MLKMSVVGCWEIETPLFGSCDVGDDRICFFEFGLTVCVEP